MKELCDIIFIASSIGILYMNNLIRALTQKGSIMGQFLVKKTNTGVKFDLLADDAKVVATSEVYKTEASCIGGVKSVMNNAPAANVEDQTVDGFEAVKHPKFELYSDKSGDFRFRLKAKNGEIIATSSAYKDKAQRRALTAHRS